MREIARWLYETIPGLPDLFPAPWLFLLAFYAMIGLIVAMVALWLFWKWFSSGLDGIPEPVHPVIQRVVVIHEHRGGSSRNGRNRTLSTKTMVEAQRNSENRALESVCVGLSALLITAGLYMGLRVERLRSALVYRAFLLDLHKAL